MARFLKRQAQSMQVDELQDSLVREWYAMSREMQQFIPITFPYFTFQGFAREAEKSNEQTKDGKVGGKSQLMGQ